MLRDLLLDSSEEMGESTLAALAAEDSEVSVSAPLFANSRAASMMMSRSMARTLTSPARTELSVMAGADETEPVGGRTSLRKSRRVAAASTARVRARAREQAAEQIRAAAAERAAQRRTRKRKRIQKTAAFQAEWTAASAAEEARLIAEFARVDAFELEVAVADPIIHDLS
ncbi:uncharacterized protein AMSG_03950 [Thecamonas trahens ATCC 50062]|uniref:Uncharacterized protein n=1 Tax=Thecamonas trahens ATCC 50062 TaxID=461836 RepID=A0A0L0D5U1_THETB|nr:hypothetical protein AMSG_03950 [Thecamonas trahens ATCC 50062]KNC47719.1 hypothetical protein AMSG_03950 [Thecamonas trahens ATCC 50062]|eukprot:XP_013759201.1 hypothetical protein AMSG_03950 [Thecamonas trahens ATCC 50062]